MCRLLTIRLLLSALVLVCAASSRAEETVFDPFAPAAKPFAESLPPSPKLPGREIGVQVLVIRQHGRVAPWPAEPAPEWQTAAEGLISLKTRLNVPVEAQQPALIEKDPAGKNLPEPLSVGSSFACRADESAEAGVYTFHFEYRRVTFTGWLEEPRGIYTPLRESHSHRSTVQLNNRWFLFGGGASTGSNKAADAKAVSEALYLRIDDGLPPAARAVSVQGPSSVTPAAR